MFQLIYDSGWHHPFVAFVGVAAASVAGVGLVMAFMVMAELGLGVRLSAGVAEGHAGTATVTEESIEDWLHRGFTACKIGSGGADDLANIGGRAAGDTVPLTRQDADGGGAASHRDGGNRRPLPAGTRRPGGVAALGPHGAALGVAHGAGVLDGTVQEFSVHCGGSTGMSFRPVFSSSCF
jgi:hypothetical protein